MKPLRFLIPVAVLAACATEDAGNTTTQTETDPTIAAALETITTDELLGKIQILSADSFGGRAPGTRGEELTVAYLTERFQAAGLQPGNPDGTFVQEVPLVGMTQQVQASFMMNGRAVPMAGGTDYIAETTRAVPEVSVENSELVFVGYGIVAPEYNWDDYKGQDMTGKTIVMLVNDPPLPDTTMFRGPAMTYYGRWTYKYEIAAQVGAAAAIVVHETGPAGYPFEVLSGGFGSEDFDIASPDRNMSRVAVQGWIPEPAIRRMLEAGGFDFDSLKAAALSADFQPVPLNGTASFRITNQMREVPSKNVIAKLEGSTRPDQYVIYTAHWDHLGTDPSLEGDAIFNGALDNATGTAGLVELAEAFAALDTPPARSILFLAVTAEERGLLGAKWYAENPLYPLTQTVANINMDGMNQWGRTSDVTVIGLGNSTLDDVIRDAAAAQGRTIIPDPEPEKGFYYRSDHFEFAKQGVPALYADAGVDYIGKPEGYGQQKRDEYTANDYHKVSDEVKPDWDLAGAVEDLALMFRVGFDVANADMIPQWREGTEFKALRDSMMAGTR